jgi:hypothetical protein
MKLSRNVRRLIEFIDRQEKIKDKGYFRDEVDNINGLEEGLLHLTQHECEQLSQLKTEERYRKRILDVAMESNLISSIVRDQIIQALKWLKIFISSVCTLTGRSCGTAAPQHNSNVRPHGMLYHYIDESFRKTREHYHSNVGGLLIPDDKIVDFEIEIEKCIPKRMPDGSIQIDHEEFKYTTFFKGKSDDEKVSLFSKFVGVVRRLEVRVVVSHAMTRHETLKALPRPGGQENLSMLACAWFNMGVYLESTTGETLVQSVVDLGISESFRPIYNTYVGMSSGVAALVSGGIEISLPNFRNLPTPLFVDSRNSRAIQLSDVLIGLLLARTTNTLSPLMARLHAELAGIHSQIQLYSVEWNKSEGCGLTSKVRSWREAATI